MSRSSFLFCSGPEEWLLSEGGWENDEASDIVEGVANESVEEDNGGSL